MRIAFSRGMARRRTVTIEWQALSFAARLTPVSGRWILRTRARLNVRRGAFIGVRVLGAHGRGRQIMARVLRVQQSGAETCLHVEPARAEAPPRAVRSNVIVGGPKDNSGFRTCVVA